VVRNLVVVAVAVVVEPGRGGGRLMAVLVLDEGYKCGRCGRGVEAGDGQDWRRDWRRDWRD
jgi:hypothetical protein